MAQERGSWHNCNNGLLITEKDGSNIYVCANSDIIESNHRPSGSFGNVIYVELNVADRQEMCCTCIYFNKRTDIRTHRKNKLFDFADSLK